MVCIYCGNKTQVINSRLQKKPNQVWRRRQCKACQAVFTSLEAVNAETSLIVSSGKHVEPFSRDKLLIDVYDSLRHRKTAISDATALTQTIWNRLQLKIKDASIARDDIAGVTYEVLQRFDKVAATHYQAFHPF